MEFAKYYNVSDIVDTMMEKFKKIYQNHHEIRFLSVKRK